MSSSVSSFVLDSGFDDENEEDFDGYRKSRKRVCRLDAGPLELPGPHAQSEGDSSLPLNTNHLLNPIRVLLTVMALWVSGCNGFNSRNGGGNGAEMEQAYSARTSLENAYGSEKIAETQDAVERHYLMGVSEGAEQFWTLFQTYRERHGKSEAQRVLRRILEAHGLNMIMGSYFGRDVVGRAEFDRILRETAGRETVFYRKATQLGYFDGEFYRVK